MNHNTFVFISVGLAVLVIALLIVIQLLTKRRKAGKPGNVSNLATSLRDEKLKSDIILNAIEDGVILIDSQKVIQLFNPGASSITGWPASEAQGLNVNSVIKLVDAKNNDYTEAQNPLNRIFEEGQTIRDNTAVLVSRSDKHLAISLSVSPLLDENKQVTAAVAIFRDVSQERAEENQRAEFISTASHEMRTPVAAIEGYLSLALNDKVSTIDSRARGYLDKAHASTQHLGKLFQDLLTSAKAEDGRLSSHPVVIEIGSYLEEIAQGLKFAAEKKGLFMEFMIGSSQTIDATNKDSNNHVIKPLYYVLADPDRMREVITNLFDNAIKYTDQGKVTIGLTGNDEVVQFYVRDTGPGIPAEDIPHLFQKFYRVDNSTTRTIGGTGLGLFICRKIVELYQGRIWVESQLEKGSTFFINLPRLSTQKAEQLQAAEAKSGTLAPITSLSAS
jgi:PAS domain S-box-containing protein